MSNYQFDVTLADCANSASMEFDVSATELFVCTLYCRQKLTSFVMQVI